MKCKKPYMLQGRIPVGCGQCLPCRVQRRRVWTVRQVLESLMHKSSAFVTLTYADEQMPDGGNLRPAHTRNFVSRLRRLLKEDGPSVRYYLVGEYGRETGRAHYHASIFGLDPCWNGRTDHRRVVCCPTCSVVQAAWSHNGVARGGVHVEYFSATTAQYVAEYTVDKLWSSGEDRRKGRVWEFSRCSNRPGLGASAMAVLAEQLHTDAGLNEMAKVGDVPKSIMIGGKHWPLGRYLRDQLRKEVGMPSSMREKLKSEWWLEKKAEVQALCILASENGRLVQGQQKNYSDAAISRSELVAERSAGAAADLEARVKIQRRRTL